MGRVHHTEATVPTHRMEARDFIWLAALGTARRGAATLDDVCMAIDDIAGHLWTPVAEVVVGCVEDMLHDGTLAAYGTGDRFITTSRGDETLALLLALPMAHPACPLAQVALRLKLAFVDLVSTELRRRCMEQAAMSYQRALDGQARDCATCGARGPFGRLWHDQDGERLGRELATLRAIADFGCGP
jgi:hypothetical protein